MADLEKDLAAGGPAPGKAGANDSGLAIGRRLRDQRQKLQMTLDQVAGSAGLTKGFLSDIERDRTAPSMTSLLRLCKTLGISVSSLFENTGSAIVRAGERKRVYFGGTGVTDYQLTPGGEGRILALWSEMDPGATSGDAEYTLNSEQEFVFVVSGSVCVSIEGQEHLLAAGDTLTFAPYRPHSFNNPSATEPARAIFVLTPPPR